MPLDLEILRRFVANHGSVTVMDTDGDARLVSESAGDISAVIAKANRFRFKGKFYDREEFERLVEERSN